MKEVMYKQCQLSKKTSEGIERQVSWIPERFAVQGSYLKLREDNGWLVESASSPAVSGSVIYKPKFSNSIR